MAHIKNRLRGLLVAFVAIVAALAIVPGVAKAALVDFDPVITGSVTITGEDVTVDSDITVYQVATIKVDGTTNVPGYEYADGMQTTVDAWVKAGGTANSAADLVQAVTDNNVAAMDPQPQIEAGTPDGVVISGLVPGVYYIDIADVAATDTTPGITYQNIVVAIEPARDGDTNDWVAVDEEIAVKSADSTLDKTATSVDKGDVSADGSTVTAVTGSKIEFKVEFTLSKNMSNFYLEDTMTGMTFGNDVKLFTVDGTEIVLDDVAEVVTEGLDGATFKFNIADVSVLKDYITEGDTADFYITYSGTVNDDAETGVAGAKNEVTSSVNTKGDEVTVDLASLKITKYGDDNRDGVVSEGDSTLVGAEFSLYTELNADGTAVDESSIVTIDDKTVFTTNENGVIELVNVLDPTETYYLVETKAPSGYKLLEDFEMVTFSKDKGYAWTKDILDEKLTKDEGVDLPETGGMGTVALTAAGVVLVAGAAAFIVRSRKES